MDEIDLDTFTLKMGEPGPKEEEFFAWRQFSYLELVTGLDENRLFVEQKRSAINDFGDFCLC